MLRFQRPTEPAQFAASTESARQEIEACIHRGQSPASSDFKNKWGPFKRHFREAQHGKCGYCEHDTHVSYYGDVEHFAPKAIIHELCANANTDADTDANEDGGSGNVPAGAVTTPYPVEKVSDLGYWWRAYDWNNYLFACARCNQIHKRGLFPVTPMRRPRRPDPANTQERALLLNPYDPQIDPAQHLAFSELGQISALAGDIRGWETIRTCRLDRHTLVDARRDKARRAYGLARRLQLCLAQDYTRELDRAVADLCRLGHESVPFAGMVRIIVEHETKLTWSDLTAWRESADDHGDEDE